MFTIAELIKYKNKEAYDKLKKISNANKGIELGDKVENLMKHNSYRRIGRRIKQVGWGR